MGAAKTGYLVLYNLVSCGGWAVVLFRVALFLASQVAPPADGGQATTPMTLEEFYPSLSLPLRVIQTLAVMEIVHAAVGLVPSNVGTTFTQVFSRVFVLWVVLEPCETDVQRSWGAVLCVGSWALVEVPRYLFYAANNLFTRVPYPLFFLRFSLFYVLYPTGITGELWSMWNSLGCLQQLPQFNMKLPNAYNFAFSMHLVVIGIMLMYISGGPTMYNHMRRQRSKAFKKYNDEAANKQA